MRRGARSGRTWRRGQPPLTGRTRRQHLKATSQPRPGSRMHSSEPRVNRPARSRVDRDSISTLASTSVSASVAHCSLETGRAGPAESMQRDVYDGDVEADDEQAHTTERGHQHAAPAAATGQVPRRSVARAIPPVGHAARPGALGRPTWRGCGFAATQGWSANGHRVSGPPDGCPAGPNRPAGPPCRTPPGGTPGRVPAPALSRRFNIKRLDDRRASRHDQVRVFEQLELLERVAPDSDEIGGSTLHEPPKRR